ncbi:MAG TPA: Hsp20/alpha crystallin family protein [Candidatus Limnocylindria bacterium]|jgi:HSP20 family protein|nr:Hsp20/alpha crystallin family protein [Candidatus Limnocylindria bacterium]
MTIARFTSLGDVVSLREAVDRLFEDSFIRPNTWPIGQLAVPVDLWETKDAYHLRADLPGLAPEDIEINATADTLTIAGEIKPSTDVTSAARLRQERRAGKFTRSFTLPTQIDPTKVEAKFQNGVLELVLPKAENVKPRTIKINASAK